MPIKLLFLMLAAAFALPSCDPPQEKIEGPESPEQLVIKAQITDEIY